MAGGAAQVHVHLPPTCASWIKQVERFFGIITQKAIRRGSFHKVGELTGKVNTLVEHYNARAHPFMWVATAEHPGEDQTPL